MSQDRGHEGRIGRTPSLRWTPALILAIGIYAHEPATARAAAPTSQSDAVELRRVTLAEALHLALAEDAPLAEADEHLADATVEAARTYPFNPFVQFQVLPYASAGTPVAADYVLMMQMLELGRQHRWRKAAGRASADQIRATRGQAQLAESVTVARLFFAALYQRGLHELLLRRIGLEEERMTVSRATGQRTAEQEALDRLASRSLHHEAELAGMARDDAQALLAMRLRMPAAHRLEVVGDLATWQWRHFQDSPAPGRSSTGHPDLAAVDAASAGARASWHLSRAARVPSLLIGPYYQRAGNRDVSVGFRAQVELPVLNAGRRLERLRAAELARRDLAAERAREDLERRAGRSIARYEHVLGLAVAYRTDTAAALNGLPGSLALREAGLRADRVQLDLMFQVAQAAADVVEATGLSADLILDVHRTR